MLPEQTQILLSQYADGTLPDEDRASVESLILSDSEAQAFLSDDRNFTELLRSAPLPDIRWDRLAASISSVIDRDAGERDDAMTSRLRIGRPAILTIAASVLLAAGVGVHLLVGRFSSVPNPVQSVATAGRLEVQGPTPDAPGGNAVIQIAISAGGTYAKDESLAPYADDIDTRPARVVIASGMTPQQTPPGFPY